MIIIQKEGYLVILKSMISQSEFVSAAGVRKGTYAEKFVLRLYDHILGALVDAKQEHKKYYSREYKNVAQFLYWKYDLDEQALGKCKAKIQADNFVGYCEKGHDGDYNLDHFLESETGEEMLQLILKKAERGKKQRR